MLGLLARALPVRVAASAALLVQQAVLLLLVLVHFPAKIAWITGHVTGAAQPGRLAPERPRSDPDHRGVGPAR
jgi:hypothetical protein